LRAALRALPPIAVAAARALLLLEARPAYADPRAGTALTNCSSQEKPTYPDDRPRERLLRLIDLIQAAHGHLRRAEELKRQAIALLHEAEACHRRVASTSRPPADSARTAGYGR
jgi:hypothetical protein